VDIISEYYSFTGSFILVTKCLCNCVSYVFGVDIISEYYSFPGSIFYGMFFSLKFQFLHNFIFFTKCLKLI
jgi:hypothetical protein